MQRYNKISLTQFVATVCKIIGIEKPQGADKPMDWVCDVMDDMCKEGYDRVLIHNPDAMGMFLYQEFPDMFEPVLKHTQLTVPFQTVMPSVTPVCFATMFTGVLPEVHGIQAYEKPVLTVDTFFDALVRAGKKVAIVATIHSSMSKIFDKGNFDIFVENTEANVVEKAQELIIEDQYDVLCVYTIGYDNREHYCGPHTPKALAAAYRECGIFDQLVSLVKRNWTNHNTLLTFSPDHGCHEEESFNSRGVPVHGKHGSDRAVDINILHYFGVVRRTK